MDHFTGQRNPSSFGSRSVVNLLTEEQRLKKRSAKEALNQYLDDFVIPIVMERLSQQCSTATIFEEIRRTLKLERPLSQASKNYILSESRKRLIAALDKTVDEVKGEAIEVYNSIIRDPESKSQDVISAQQRKDKLLGLERAQKRISAAGVRGLMEQLEIAEVDVETDD